MKPMTTTIKHLKIIDRPYMHCSDRGLAHSIFHLGTMVTATILTKSSYWDQKKEHLDLLTLERAYRN